MEGQEELAQLVSDTPPATAVTDIDQAHKEAITVNRIHPRVMKMVIDGASNQLADEGDPNKKAQLQAEIDRFTKLRGNMKYESELAAAFLDHLQKEDPKHYEVLTDLSIQAHKLESMVSQDIFIQLSAELGHEKVTLRDEFSRVGVNTHLVITDFAFTGQAIDRLRRRPSFHHLPTNVWGQLFALNMAEVRYHDYIQSKE